MNIETDFDFFYEKLTIIGEIYNREVSEHLFKIYWNVLEGYEIEDVSRAFEAHMKNTDSGQYFPKPADIIRLIEGSGETKALKAWTKVDWASSRIGVYKSVAFDDPIIHAVISDMGGWDSFCLCDLDETPFKGSEFRKRYMGYVNNPPQKYPRYFVGIYESLNSQSGFAFESPVLIGDEIKARDLMLMKSHPTLDFLTGGT